MNVPEQMVASAMGARPLITRIVAEPDLRPFQELRIKDLHAGSEFGNLLIVVSSDQYDFAIQAIPVAGRMIGPASEVAQMVHGIFAADLLIPVLNQSLVVFFDGREVFPGFLELDDPLMSEVSI